MPNPKDTHSAMAGSFDQCIIEEMRTALGDATLSRLMEYFAQDLAKAERELDEGQMRGDHNALKIAAHNLKGLASQYGASQLAREAAKLDISCAASCGDLEAEVRLIQSLCELAIEDSIKYQHQI